ncbi:MAG: hypothetical protein ACRBFS_21725 [Aureispira sp.]
MTVQEVIQQLEAEILQLKQEQEHHNKHMQAFSNLDTKLRARKAKGAILTKEDPAIKRLLELGNLIKWEKPTGAPDVWYRLEGKIESCKEHIELIKQIDIR